MTVSTLNGNTVLYRPGTAELVVLAAGDAVPGWAEGLIGAHLIADEPTSPPAARPKPKAAAKPTPALD